MDIIGQLRSRIGWPGRKLLLAFAYDGFTHDGIFIDTENREAPPEYLDLCLLSSSGDENRF